MKISELATLTNTPASTLRYYEKIGLLPLAERKSGQRHYASDIIWQVNLIGLAKDVGFNLNEISLLFKAGVLRDDWEPLVENKLLQLEKDIEKLTNMSQMLKNTLSEACDSVNFQNKFGKLSYPR